MKTNLLSKSRLGRLFVASAPGFRSAAITTQAAGLGANVRSPDRRTRPWIAFASVLVAFTSFVSAQNADLSALVPSSGTLDPVFDSAAVTYNATVPLSTTSITVTPTVVEAGATVTVNATPVTSGSASDPIALSVGPNVITTEVTSADLVTTKTYTLTVTRSLADLKVDFQATISSQLNSNATGEGKYYHVSLAGPNPGTGSFCANIPGTNNPAPPFVRNYDGPVEAYKWAGGTNNVITAVSRSGGNAASITFATNDTAFDGFGQDVAKLWTTTDPGADIKVGALLSASPNTTATGWRDLGGAVCTIDVTAVSAGSVHFYYGNYNGKPKVSVVMRDTDGPAPDLTIAEAHLNGDSGDLGEFYLAEIDFDTDGGTYDEIEILFDANGDGSTVTGNGRGIGVVVTSSVADAVAPTLVPADIVDNVSGGPFTSTGASITYTVTYSELMDPATIDASDFGLGGTATATIDSVVHYGGVTTVVVTPTLGTSGTLLLQVNDTAVLTDLAGNALDTTSAIADDPAVSIVSDVTPPTLVSITESTAGPVLEGQTVIYTVTFDEPMKASTIETTDFENGGSPAGVIAAVNATANPAVYEVLASSAYPGGTGTLILQIKADATLEDPSGNLLVTGGSPIPDDTTITVNAQEARQTVTVDLPAASAENTSATLTLTYDASGSDKLVINATKEGNPNPYTTLTYEGQPLTLAVSTGSNAGNQHWNGIYYLDNPGNYDNGSGPVGEIVATSGSSRNVITAVGLSNTAPGFGATAAPPTPNNSKSVTIGLSYVNSAVIASHGMGQDGNTANVTSVNTISPLIEIAGSALENGNNWVGHVTGYAATQGPGLVTYSFTGGNTNGTNTIAAEFPGAVVVADPFAAWAGAGTLGSVTFEGDTNGDGVQDGLAFLLGVTNPDDDATGNLPTVTETAGGLQLNFNCLPVDDRGTAKLYVQHSTDLSTWTTSPTGVEVPDDTNAVPNNNVTFVVGAGPAGPPALNSVTATIGSGAAAGGKLFGRLQATE